MKDKTKNTPQVLLRRALLVLLDAAIVAFSFYFALLLRADGAVEAGWWPHNRALLYENLPWIVAVYIVCFLAGGLYSVLWKYAGERDLIRLAGMIVVPTAVVYVVNRRFIHGVLFNSANCMASVLIFLFIGGSRLAWRLFLNHPLGERMRKVPAKDPNRPVLIVGAGEAGAWAINVCKSNKEYGHAVVAVDDDPAKLNQTIHGVPVKGTLEDIPELCNRYGIHSIIIAIPTLKGSKLSHVIDLCVSTHCAVQLLSDPQLVGSGAPQQEVFRELNPADFLSREEVTLDTDKISGYLTGKTVLVTGGGGSIGSELCRQVMRFKPGKLLIFDIYENCAYELQMELQQKYGRDIPVTVLIGSIRDKKRLDEVFDTYHPTVVFHAAAHKHVPLMEVSPAEAVKNNVLGTKNLLVSASEHGVERFVQLSTDKAVNPTSVMGCTKRICEMLIQTFAGNTDMKCVAVRFGNVLGSHGSVIPLFEAQIKKGGPVTLTDPNIVRYFMTIPEAAQLVLQAGALAESGNIYVLDMGEPVRIMDLAKQLIRFYGYEPGVNMEIKIVGLRPGEKLYEELMMDEEQDKMRRTQHNKIFVASPRTIDLAEFYEQLQALEAAAAAAVLGLLALNGCLPAGFLLPGGSYVQCPAAPVLSGLLLVALAECGRVADGADGTVCGAAFVTMLGLMLLETQLSWFPLAVLPAALAGALTAFLLWNFPPAKLRPGKCGCLFLAGAVGCIPLSIGYGELSVPLALPFWAEGGMVLLQILFYRATGRALFRTAPLHRWLEQRGAGAVNLFYSMCILSACGLLLAMRFVR